MPPEIEKKTEQSPKQSQRKSLLFALTTILVLLAAFQNCAAPIPLKLSSECKVYPEIPSLYEYYDRSKGLTLIVDNSKNRVQLLGCSGAGSSPNGPCSVEGYLDADDANFINDEFAILQAASVSDSPPVAMYLHGSTLTFSTGDENITTTLWLTPGDRTAPFETVCTSPDTLIAKFEELIAQLQTQALN